MKTTTIITFFLTVVCSQSVSCFSPTATIFRSSTTNQQESSSRLWEIHRRDVLAGAATAIAGNQLSPNANAMESSPNLQADLPMIRLKLPPGGLGKDYIALQVKIQGMGPFDFMVDSGLTTELITPHLQESIGIGASNKKMTGYAAGGSQVQSLVDLDGLALTSNSGNNQELVLPKLHALIVDFPQEHIDPAHDPVEGMLGMELLSQFDVDFDFPNQRVRFWKPGTAPTNGLVEIPAVVINETGLIGIRVTLSSGNQQQQQPILGFLDCGSTFSCLNWKAAQTLGLPPKGDVVYQKSPSVQAIGVDGRPLLLPILQQSQKHVSFVGNAQVDSASGIATGFDQPPAEWKPWDSVPLAIGDIPAFSSALGDGLTPYQGPAALIGLDILGQRRFLLQAGTGNSRLRRVFVAPQ